MNILVPIKQVPDTASKITVKADGSGIDDSGLKWVMSPYDEFALEAALRIRESGVDAKVIAFTAGPDRSKDVLRTALAMGADQAHHMVVDGQADHVSLASCIAEFAKAQSVDMVWLGRQAVDEDQGMLAGILSQKLDWPLVSNVCEFNIEDKSFSAVSVGDAGRKTTWKGALPGVFSATKGLNEPRYASLKGIMQAKKKPISPVEGESASIKTYQGFQPPKAREACIMIEGESVETKVAELTKRLREDAKVL